MQTVALLGRDDGARASLRRALEELGAQVVLEADPAGVKADQVLASGAHTVIVNLASGVEDDIDHLQDVFDDARLNVVFNEADVSSQLEGWDLARWARHLASKVTGNERTIPPPPPGAELLPLRSFMPVPGAPPTPAQLTPERPIEEFMIEAEDRADGVPDNHLPYASGRRPAPPVEEPETEFSVDVSEIEGALAQIGGPPPVEQIAVPEPVVPEIVVREDEAAEFDAGLDLAALDAALELDSRPPEPAPGKSDKALLDEALSGFDLDLSADAGTPSADDGLTSLSLGSDGLDLEELDDSGLSVEPISLSDDGLGLDDIDAGSLSIASVSLSSDGLGVDELDAGGSLLDDDVAALAAQLDAMDSGPRGEVKDLDFGAYDDEPEGGAAAKAPASAAARAAAPAAPSPAPTPGAKKSSFGPLDLTPLDDDIAVPAPSTPPAAPAKKAYDFGSLNLSLEPTDDDGAAPGPTPAPAAAAAKKPAYDFSGLDLSLEPSEEELAAAPAPTPAATAAPADEPGGDLDALFAAMDLAPTRAAPGTSTAPAASAAGLRRVIVLGASIGGPDALRSFLGGIPENFPALFVLAQHLESGFFERLAQQLQKSSKLPVKVPDGSARAAHGEVLVIPARQRVRIERDGTVSFHDHDGTPKYTPCIDQVLRDVADTFGGACSAIIFSGMAGDAIEGAVYLTSQGGEVWAQDPASCVVSSMVDGARARGVVEFVGSPRELAERCVAKYGKG